MHLNCTLFSHSPSPIAEQIHFCQSLAWSIPTNHIFPQWEGRNFLAAFAFRVNKDSGCKACIPKGLGTHMSPALQETPHARTTLSRTSQHPALPSRLLVARGGQNRHRSR